MHGAVTERGNNDIIYTYISASKNLCHNNMYTPVVLDLNLVLLLFLLLENIRDNFRTVVFWEEQRPECVETVVVMQWCFSSNSCTYFHKKFITDNNPIVLWYD